MLFIMPMWINFVLRAMAMKDLLTLTGILGVNSYLSVIIGMVYDYLPFMILPIYTVLIKMDKNLIEASHDLGANGLYTFRKVIFPLSTPGIASGITMVFMPAVSTFVISRLLGGGQYMLLGNLIEQQFTTMGDWNFGSAIAIFMMIVILLSMGIMNLFEGSDDK